MRRSLPIKTSFTPSLFLVFILLSIHSNAQISWDGGGDGTSWNDAANWEMDVLPPADSVVIFEQDVVLTGNAAVGPARITISGGKTVTLDLDLNLGNGQVDDHAIVLNSRATLNLGTPGANRTFTLNPTSNKQGIAIFASADSATVNLASGNALLIENGTNGINVANANSKANIDGTITISSAVKNGIKSSGTVVNNGSLIMNELITDGIVLNGGTFENTATGNIEITKPGEDCIEIIDSSFFTNLGQIEVTAMDSAGSGNNALAVGNELTKGTFINASSGLVSANGGAKESGRAISVNEMGVWENSGKISLSGGGEGSRLYNRGESTNKLGGLLDLTDGRVNVNAGIFVNEGLLKTSRDGSGVFTGAFANNYGFFDYANSNLFASGSNGTVNDYGINLNDSSEVNIDAMTSCTVDIAEAAYEWSEGSKVIGTADNTGSLTLAAKSLSMDPVMLNTDIQGISIVIHIHNFCPEALDTLSGLGPEIASQQLRLFPSVLGTDQELTIDLRAFDQELMPFQLVAMTGQVLKTFNLMGGQSNSIYSEGLPLGMYLLVYRDATKIVQGRFTLLK